MQPSEDGFILGGRVSLSRMLSLGLRGGPLPQLHGGACAAGLGVRWGRVSLWTLRAWPGEDLTPRCVVVTPEGLDLRDKVSKIATGCGNFKVAFCLLLSGILKGDTSQTEKTTQQQPTPSQTQANKNPQPPTNNRKTLKQFLN